MFEAGERPQSSAADDGDVDGIYVVVLVLSCGGWADVTRTIVVVCHVGHFDVPNVQWSGEEETLTDS